MAYQVTLRMQNGVERDVACYGYECHIAHSDRPDIGRIIAAHMEVCQKLGTAEYLPVEGDLIALTFESTDHDNFFYEWLLQGNMANGEIEFATGDDIVDIFRFWDCYCVSLEETLCTGEMPMLMTVLLSPGILKRMNCEPREKVWKVSDISVKPRVVDNDEKHNSEPMVLVTSVKGESKAIVSQTVQYVVTKYSVSNVKDSDRKRVKWVIEVDGQKEYLKEQGETLDLQIKEEWEGKEIIVMPYLNQATLQVSVKTNIQGLIDVYTQSDKYLFSLEPNNKHKSQKITAKELYKKGIQWFSPTADNYLRLIKKSSNLSQYDELKHFSWEKVIEFAEEDRFMFAYRKGGSGDWKAEGNPGDGFLLVTINGMPYWADAIGQIPFALNEFRNCLKFYGNYKLAEIETLRIGRKFGDGKLFGQSDESNSYDNEMIKRAIKWAKNRYRVVNIDSWNKNAVIKTTDYPPNLLSEPL